MAKKKAKTAAIKPFELRITGPDVEDVERHREERWAVHAFAEQLEAALCESVEAPHGLEFAVYDTRTENRLVHYTCK